MVPYHDNAFLLWFFFFFLINFEVLKVLKLDNHWFSSYKKKPAAVLEENVAEKDGSYFCVGEWESSSVYLCLSNLNIYSWKGCGFLCGYCVWQEQTGALSNMTENPTTIFFFFLTKPCKCLIDKLWMIISVCFHVLPCCGHSIWSEIWLKLDLNYLTWDNTDYIYRLSFSCTEFCRK